MKKLIGVVWLLALSSLMTAIWNSTPVQRVWAGVACSVPFTFVNGTVADATQVNSNFSALVTCLGNAAGAGVNSDITTLAGLTTPISATAGGTQSFYGTGVTGVNTITIPNTLPVGFSLTAGRRITFLSAGANTSNVTLNVAGFGAVPMVRPSSQGTTILVGGEIGGVQIVEAVYDGTQFDMVSAPASAAPVGISADFVGAGGCPPGWIEEANGPVGTGNFPALSAVLGLTWGNPGGGMFQVPDLRGRTTYERDLGGSGRITAAGGNFDGTVFSNVGGQQNQTLTLAQLPATPAPVTATITTTCTASGQNCLVIPNGTAGSAVTTGGTSSVFQTGNYSGIVLASTLNSNTANLGAGNAHPVLSNGVIVYKCVKG